MEKKRVEFGEDYYFIDTTTQICCGCEFNLGIESKLFDAGNYFTTKGEAEACVRKLRAVLNGADVIVMPSGTEIVDAAEEHIEACDEDGCPYADVEDAKTAFGNGVAWLKSKIIK